MDHFELTLLLLVIGMILLGTGYHHREKALGIFTLWIGALMMLGVTFYNILDAVRI